MRLIMIRPVRTLFLWYSASSLGLKRPSSCANPPSATRPRFEAQQESPVFKGMKLIAVCLIGLVLVGHLSGTAGATTGHSGRKLLQPGGRRTNNPNLAANTVRAQAATAQSIEEAVNTGGSLGAARKAGQTGVTTTWAANQRQTTFDIVDRNSGPLNTAFGH